MEDREQAFRRGLAAIGGVLAMCVALFAALYVLRAVVGVATDTSGGDGYADPSRGVRLLAALGFAVVGFGATGLFAWGGLGLYRYGESARRAWSWWVPVRLVGGAAAAFGWIVAFLLYAASLGAFS